MTTDVVPLASDEPQPAPKQDAPTARRLLNLLLLALFPGLLILATSYRHEVYSAAMSVVDIGNWLLARFGL